MAKIKLDIQPYADISVIAVCAPMRDYRFIWHLNNHLGVHFTQDVPFNWPHKKLKMHFEYAVFRCPEHAETIFMNNRNENVQLLPALSTIDYFVVFSEHPGENELTSWMNEIRSIPGITLTTLLNGKQLDEFRHILSELEYQEMQRNIEAKKIKSKAFE
ncbi:hypothetical protein SDC9_72715 [bioreactor metagenome]|uniref:IPExxxVDY family protein n=1 Tax=bioreactor metagenome TaxID=1076179 RepID=A0A644YJB6_9ZZZZ